ncbi:hypothetical protein NFI96_029384 [Prochilodus magdalenae]|nr:hypothetical protein NFI96_029384 [Prochilodus magdalenae]
MADSKQVIPGNSEWNTGFTEELLPSSQQVCLLYHISYLCLAKFPKLERLLRMRAVETQLLFGSSEAVLLKCVGTSKNLISSLFPMLTHAIEKNKPTLAIKYLEKARVWITEIIQDVEKIVQRYEVHNKDVATTTSDVITEKTETEKVLVQLSKEIEVLTDEIQKLEVQLKETNEKLAQKEKEIEAKNLELQSVVKDAAAKNKVFGIFASIVPFIGQIVSSIYKAVTAPGVAEKVKAFEIQLNQLTSDKVSLKQEVWDLEVETIDLRMKLAKLQIDQGVIPEPTQLGEVQTYLSKIQKILIQLQKFWEHVFILLGIIKNKTFVGEDLVEEPELKEQFLLSIQDASQSWKSFGGSCCKAAQIFRVKSKDAYSFLEIDPSSLSEDVWQKEYDSVKKQLEQLQVTADSPKEIMSNSG